MKNFFILLDSAVAGMTKGVWMTKMKTKLKIYNLIIFLLIFSINAVSAPSRNMPKAFSFTPFIGFHSGYNFGNLNPLPNTADIPAVKVFLENREVAAGMSFGYFFSDRFEFQGTFTFRRTRIMNDVGIGMAGIPLGIVKVSDANSLSYCGNILYHFPFGKYSMYLAAGIGATTLMPEQLSTKTRLLLNFGGGIKAKISKSIHAVLDIRDYVSFFNYPVDFDLVYILIYTADFKASQHHLGINAGLSFLF